MNAAENTRQERTGRLDIGDKGAILLMLYNTAIELLEEAKTALERGDLAGKGVHISQAHAIISELLASLDFEVGGELAMNLENLYLFMLDQLMAAHIKNEPKALDAVLSILRPLYVSWEGAIAAERQRIAQEYEQRGDRAA
ncbi:MAG TPA: flagellar export chaperone FliS [Candidatus Binatia bacterium]|jgi:flagellar protein FliS|nr:flagellar export chaperone FliS [Candidatus Binatia bacterium]